MLSGDSSWWCRRPMNVVQMEIVGSGRFTRHVHCAHWRPVHASMVGQHVGHGCQHVSMRFALSVTIIQTRCHGHRVIKAKRCALHFEWRLGRRIRASLYQALWFFQVCGAKHGIKSRHVSSWQGFTVPAQGCWERAWGTTLLASSCLDAAMFT